MSKIKIGANSPQPQEALKSQTYSPPMTEERSPEASPLESSTSSPAPQADSSHLDGLIVQEGGAADGDSSFTPAAAPVMIQREDFTKLFFSGFDVAHAVTKLQSLKIPAGDEGATGCAVALYDTILDVPALHFMLYPQGKWLPRIVAIAAFTSPMGRAVGEELRARQRGPEKAGNFSEAVRATRAGGEEGPDAEQAEALGAIKH